MVTFSVKVVLNFHKVSLLSMLSNPCLIYSRGWDGWHHVLKSYSVWGTIRKMNYLGWPEVDVFDHQLFMHPQSVASSQKMQQAVPTTVLPLPSKLEQLLLLMLANTPWKQENWHLGHFEVGALETQGYWEWRAAQLLPKDTASDAQSVGHQKITHRRWVPSPPMGLDLFKTQSDAFSLTCHPEFLRRWTVKRTISFK